MKILTVDIQYIPLISAPLLFYYQPPRIKKNVLGFQGNQCKREVKSGKHWILILKAPGALIRENMVMQFRELNSFFYLSLKVQTFETPDQAQ